MANRHVLGMLLRPTTRAGELVAMNQRIVNPECRDGKHPNCDGHGWDIDADTAVRCPCTCHRCPACGHPTHPDCRA